MSPTIVNNVESLCHVVHILKMSGAEYAKLGTPNNTGTRILCVEWRCAEARLLRGRSRQGRLWAK